MKFGDFVNISLKSLFKFNPINYDDSWLLSKLHRAVDMDSKWMRKIWKLL